MACSRVNLLRTVLRVLLFINVIVNSSYFCFSSWLSDPTKGIGTLFLRYVDQTHRRTTVGRTPLDEWSARRIDLCLTTQHSQQTEVHAPGRIEPPKPAGKRPPFHVLDREATRNGVFVSPKQISSSVLSHILAITSEISTVSEAPVHSVHTQIHSTHWYIVPWCFRMAASVGGEDPGSIPITADKKLAARYEHTASYVINIRMCVASSPSDKQQTIMWNLCSNKTNHLKRLSQNIHFTVLTSFCKKQHQTRWSVSWQILMCAR